MKREKGFTLIELLAVIVILAIILLIAIPIILNIIEDVRKGAFKSSIHGYVKAAEYKHLKGGLSGTNEEKTFIYVDGLLQGEENLDYGGETPKNGTIHITKDGKVALAIHNGKWCATKNHESKEIIINDKEKEECKLENLPEQNPIVNGYHTIKEVNHPVLTSGMKPIIYNESTGEWDEVTEKNPDWYDYGNKKWANVKTKDGSMWVWIPRYAYKMESGYNSSTVGEIDVKFLKGKTNESVDGTTIETSEYEVGVKDTSMHYFLHPAFQFDGEELGFWVAKFEPTAVEGVTTVTGTCSGDNVTTKTVKIEPNATSWRCITIGNAYTVSRNMKDKTNIYGWNVNQVDTHMMKNTEWGAVTYLSKSKYGAHNEEVWNNAYNQFQTGCSGSGVNASNESTCIAYNNISNNGLKASTTHNIYGIYDMSGGAWERVAGYVNSGHGNLTLNGDSLYKAESLYKHIYLVGETDTRSNNYEANKNIYGDAVYETSNTGDSTSGSWYKDYSNMPSLSSPFFDRGGSYGQSSNAGIFSFINTAGNASINYSFRPVVFAK